MHEDNEEEYFSAFELNSGTLDYAFGVVLYVDNVPQSFGKIASRDGAAQWMKAVHSAIERLSNRSVINCIFARKRNEVGKLTSYKARLVAR